MSYSAADFVRCGPREINFKKKFFSKQQFGPWSFGTAGLSLRGCPMLGNTYSFWLWKLP